MLRIFAYATHTDEGCAPCSFACRQLLLARWAARNDPGFPRSGSATFVASSTVIPNAVFLGTDLIVNAVRDSTWARGDDGALGRLSMRFANYAAGKANLGAFEQGFVYYMSAKKTISEASPAASPPG